MRAPLAFLTAGVLGVSGCTSGALRGPALPAEIRHAAAGPTEALDASARAFEKLEYREVSRDDATGLLNAVHDRNNVMTYVSVAGLIMTMGMSGGPILADRIGVSIVVSPDPPGSVMRARVFKNHGAIDDDETLAEFWHAIEAEGVHLESLEPSAGGRGGTGVTR